MIKYLLFLFLLLGGWMEHDGVEATFSCGLVMKFPRVTEDDGTGTGNTQDKKVIPDEIRMLANDVYKPVALLNGYPGVIGADLELSLTKIEIECAISHGAIQAAENLAANSASTNAQVIVQAIPSFQTDVLGNAVGFPTHANLKCPAVRRRDLKEEDITALTTTTTTTQKEDRHLAAAAKEDVQNRRRLNWCCSVNCSDPSCWVPWYQCGLCGRRNLRISEQQQRELDQTAEQGMENKRLAMQADLTTKCTDKGITGFDCTQPEVIFQNCVWSA